MPNINPAQKLKNEVLQNRGGFKFLLLFLCFDFLSACRTQSTQGVLFGAPLDPIRSQLLEPALINILVPQIQVPNTLLLRVRDRLTDTLIPTWVRIRLKARYSRSARFPALGQKKLWRENEGGSGSKTGCKLDLQRKGRGEEGESFGLAMVQTSSLGMQKQLPKATLCIACSFRKKTVTITVPTVFLCELSPLEGIFAAGPIHPSACIPPRSPITHVAPLRERLPSTSAWPLACEAPGADSHVSILRAPPAAAAAKAIGELPGWAAGPPCRGRLRVAFGKAGSGRPGQARWLLQCPATLRLRLRLQQSMVILGYWEGGAHGEPSQGCFSAVAGWAASARQSHGRGEVACRGQQGSTAKCCVGVQRPAPESSSSSFWMGAIRIRVHVPPAPFSTLPKSHACSLGTGTHPAGRARARSASRAP